MKKELYLIVFLSSCILSNAQNWQLFNHADKYNYLNLKDSMIHTIWVDSVSAEGEDSLQFFNKVLHYKNVWSTYYNDSVYEATLTNNKLFNQVCTKTGDSLFFLGLEKEWLIKPKKGLNASWEFSDTVDAVITEYRQDTILNIPDSTKTIELSNDQVIKISKSFGIVYWMMGPDKEFKLIGIDGVYGISVPTFADYFDYNVGDVFQYVKEEYIESEHAAYTYFMKFSVTSKEVHNDSLFYRVDGIMKTAMSGIVSDPWGNPLVITDEWSEEIMHQSLLVNNSDFFVNKYYNELVEVKNTSLGFYPTIYGPDDWLEEHTYYSMDVMLSANNEIVKCFSLDLIDAYPLINYRLLLRVNPDSDTITYRSIEYGCENLFSFELKPGIGVSFYSWTDGMSPGRFEFVGAIIDGDTIGTVNDDSYFMVSINNNPATALTVYPNPFTNELHLTIKSNSEIEIFDLKGMLVYTSFLPLGETTLNLEKLKKGLYIMKLTDDSGFHQTKIMKE